MTAAVSFAPSFDIRPADASDRAYVLRSWFGGARQTRWARDLGPIFFEEHGRVIESILDRSTCRIAHVPGEPAAILGFAVMEHNAFHWVHVRTQFRRQGIAKALASEFATRGSVQCSHWPPDGGNGRLVYNPYRLFSR